MREGRLQTGNHKVMTIPWEQMGVTENDAAKGMDSWDFRVPSGGLNPSSSPVCERVCYGRKSYKYPYEMSGQF